MVIGTLTFVLMVARVAWRICFWVSSSCAVSMLLKESKRF
jgi:hypothetical protein